MKKQKYRKFKSGLSALTLAVFIGAVCAVMAIAPAHSWAALASLKTVPVPEPLNLSTYVRNRIAAIQLGKALFWDMQVGSDGVQACGTCHFHAGADDRTKNQLNPGSIAGDAVFGNNLLGLPAPASGFGPNVTMTATKFPFHKLLNKDQIGEPLQNPANVVTDCNDVVSSQGVALTQFVDIQPGNPVDLGTPIPDSVFNLAGVNIRRVEPRNTPSVINAVYNFTNFWDGRGNNIFNGNNPFGPADPRPHAIINTAAGLATAPVIIRQASLASQAVGPPLSDFEMSWQGRTWPKIGKKMLSLKPLAQQRVHPQDSYLGPLADNVAGSGLTTTYGALIQKAFASKFWNNTTEKVTFDVNGVPGFSLGSPLTTDEYTQMESNFALFFGLAVQMYESTLVANDSPFDRFMEGAGAQTLQENLGMKIFDGTGGCSACHFGAEMTDDSVLFNQGANPATGVPQPLNKNPLNAVEFMAFFAGTGLYDTGFHNTAVRPGGDTVPTAPEYLAANEDIGRGADTPFIDPVSGTPFPLSFGLLGLWKAGAPTNPPYPAWTAAFYSPYVPPLPIGFRATDTTPYAGRVADFGAFKTPAMRNVELTGPYFHNGGAATLRQVVDFYTRGSDFPATNVKAADPAMLPIGFLVGSSTRKSQLVAFLLSLTDQRVKNESAPFDHPEIFVPIDGRAPVSPGSRAGLLANARFKQIPAVGIGGRPAEALPPLGTFLGLDPFRP